MRLVLFILLKIIEVAMITVVPYFIGRWFIFNDYDYKNCKYCKIDIIEHFGSWICGLGIMIISVSLIALGIKFFPCWIEANKVLVDMIMGVKVL